MQDELYHFDLYQDAAENTAVYPDKGDNLYYPTLGLAGEAGEVCEKIKKVMRDQKGHFTEQNVEEIAKELGIDHHYILGSLKHLADSSDDQNVALQSLKELGKAIGTLGGTTKKIETGVVGLFQGFSDNELEGARRSILPEPKEES